MKLYDDYPILTEAQVRRIAESMIPAHLRPYYVGDSILKYDLRQPWTAWNCDICLYFKYPVVGDIDDAREAHSDLEHMEQELANMRLDPDSRNEELAEWDETADGQPVVEIKSGRIVPWKKVGA